MRCEVRTCRNHQPRKGRTSPGLCIGHSLLLALSPETRAEFVDRQERQDMLRGRTLREEAGT